MVPFAGGNQNVVSLQIFAYFAKIRAGPYADLPEYRGYSDMHFDTDTKVPVDRGGGMLIVKVGKTTEYYFETPSRQLRKP